MLSAGGRCRAAALSAAVAVRGAVEDAAGDGVDDDDAHATLQAIDAIASVRRRWAA